MRPQYAHSCRLTRLASHESQCERCVFHEIDLVVEDPVAQAKTLVNSSHKIVQGAQGQPDQQQRAFFEPGKLYRDGEKLLKIFYLFLIRQIYGGAHVKGFIKMCVPGGEETHLYSDIVNLGSGVWVEKGR